MKPAPELVKKQLDKAKSYLIIVEGKKDKKALEVLGFENIFVLNEMSRSIYEKIEEIEEKAGRDKICILTDFDKQGKRLYLFLKSELARRKVKMDNSLRGLLLKLKVSHIEGLRFHISESS